VIGLRAVTHVFPNTARTRYQIRTYTLHVFYFAIHGTIKYKTIKPQIVK